MYRHGFLGQPGECIHAAVVSANARRPPRVRALDGDLAMLEAGLTAGHEVVTPLRELRRRHAMATTEALE